MARQLLDVGDRLVGITAPGTIQYRAGSKGVLSIGVDQLPGPMGYYLVANVIFQDDRADLIIPLHAAEEILVSNP